MKNVVVLFGGRSVEHEVSIITGILTANAIDKNVYNVFPIYIDQNGVWRYDEKITFDVDALNKADKSKLKKVTFISGNNMLFEVKGKKLKQITGAFQAAPCAE